jgi:hypothetical protein
MMNYPLLDVRVTTPTLELRGATDELLDQLADVVRAGKTHADPAPYDDPMSFYETDPDLRVAKWLRAIWQRRGTVEPDAWRLYFVVMVDGRPVGEQTLTGVHFSTLGTVTTFPGCLPINAPEDSGVRCARRSYTSRSTASGRRKHAATPSWTTKAPTRSPDVSATSPTGSTGRHGAASPPC